MSNTQSPEIPKWSALLVEAVNKPGLIMEAYRHFISIRLAINSLLWCNAACEEYNPALLTPSRNGKH